jgi:hypothetical protein
MGGRMNTNELHFADGWMGRALALAALLGTSACGSVVVGTPGTGGAGATGVTGAGGVGTGPATTGTTTTGTGVTTTSTGVTTSSSSGGTCSPACGYMLTCCDDTCAELDNDLLNCGGCGIVCPGAHPYCHKGVCEPEPACSGAPPCPSGDFCCGGQCCSPDEICCDNFGGPPQPSPRCEKPVNGTCEHSCFLCN